VFGIDDGLLENMVELVDEQPRAPIRHSHRAPGRRDGATVADGFEQADLAVADCSSGPEIETQRKPRHPGSLINAAGARSHFGDGRVRLTAIYFTKYIAHAIVNHTRL
jgi:hypothetical protein